jgi:hypothetical protein
MSSQTVKRAVPDWAFSIPLGLSGVELSSREVLGLV